MLRTNIEFSGADKRVIVVTSCVPAEGKSSVSFGLASALAEDGKRVLLIDVDLRKSVFLATHQVKGRLKGLTHYLSGQAQVEEIILQTQIENLNVITTGITPPNPAELLGSTDFANLVEEMRTHYDYIVFDAPPLGSVIDAAVVAKCCDGAIMVISAGTIKHKFAEMVKEQLELSGCPFLGVVLNKVDMNQNKYYGNYYGSYYGNE